LESALGSEVAAFYNLPMPAYFLVDTREIKNAAKMEEYKARVTPIVERFGGRYLVIGGPFEVVEGEWRPVFPVLIQFPSMDDARRWYDSEDYRELKQLRLSATAGSGVFIAGK
jgi:uncharacterized protein (DUF1330 family)